MNITMALGLVKTGTHRARLKGLNSGHRPYSWIAKENLGGHHFEELHVFGVWEVEPVITYRKVNFVEAVAYCNQHRFDIIAKSATCEGAWIYVAGGDVFRGFPGAAPSKLCQVSFALDTYLIPISDKA